MAALILRVLHRTFPQVLWAFVFVDDYALILPTDQARHLTLAIICFLHAVRLPIFWKKTALGTPNTWLGYLINTNTCTACLTPDKQTTVTNALEAATGTEFMDIDTFQKTAGRLN